MMAKCQRRVWTKKKQHMMLKYERAFWAEQPYGVLAGVDEA